MSNPIRDAIGAALDHPFAEEAFQLVDRVESLVTDLDFEGDPDHHETAAEISDQITDTLSYREQAVLWAVLDANQEGSDLYGEHEDTRRRIVADLFVVVERAVHAALTAASSA